eukprot:330192-Pyramimonas_sp.AAC.1
MGARPLSVLGTPLRARDRPLSVLGTSSEARLDETAGRRRRRCRPKRLEPRSQVARLALAAVCRALEVAPSGIAAGDCRRHRFFCACDRPRLTAAVFACLRLQRGAVVPQARDPARGPILVLDQMMAVLHEVICFPRLRFAFATAHGAAAEARAPWSGVRGGSE